MTEPSDTKAERDPGKLVKTARRTDSMPGLVAGAKFVRRLLPGDESYGDALSTAGEGIPQHLGRLVAERELQRPSAVRELGLGALQAWQALSESQRRGRGTVDLAILFTDLVGFSSWALEAGDEATLELLRQVGAVEKEAISDNEGTLVKRLGDGAMAVFSDPAEAVRAALYMQGRLAEISVEGYTPELRAGVHLGRPRKIGSDYLGVDVNIAARVGGAGKAGQVLISDPTRQALDESSFTFGRQRRLKAPGAPSKLTVCSVEGRS